MMFRLIHSITGFLVSAAVLTLLLSGCEELPSPARPISLSGRTMGTLYHIKVAELPEGLTEHELQAEVDRRLETVNDQMSTYRPESELSRFNRYEGTDWFDVSAATAYVVHEAQKISELSQGAFDTTVGPLVNLWGFGSAGRVQRAPAAEQLNQVRRRIGYQRLHVRLDRPAVRKSHSDLNVDLSAIAKGYGVDQIAEYLESVGISSYMVEIGGEVRTSGVKADGTAWRIGIEVPATNRNGIQRVLALGQRSLATSGDYRNYFEENGQRHSHMIDPRTGRPIAHRLASVSVIADQCIHADAWATTLMVLGPEEGYNFAVQQNLPALLIVRSDTGFLEKPTPEFQRLFEVSGET